MASVHDIAAYILRKQGPLSAMKLQKLVYYAQAWGLVWDEAPLFPEKIEAWANGPVVPALYEIHRGHFELNKWPRGKPQRLSPDQRRTVDSVLKFYGARSSQWLSDLTHMEDPWKDARQGLSDGERGSVEIPRKAMESYYGSIAHPKA